MDIDKEFEIWLEELKKNNPEWKVGLGLKELLKNAYSHGALAEAKKLRSMVEKSIEGGKV